MKLWTWEIIMEQQEESITKTFWRVTHALDLSSAWAGFCLELVQLFAESVDIFPVSSGGYLQTPSLQIQSGFNKRVDFMRFSSMGEEVAQDTIGVILQSSGTMGRHQRVVLHRSKLQTSKDQAPREDHSHALALPATLPALSAFYLLSPSPFSRSQVTLWRDCGAMGTERSPPVAQALRL